MKHSLIIAALALLSLSSCLHDDSTAAGSASDYAGITVTSSWTDSYTVDQFSQLVIDAPQVEQSPASRTMTYVWEVDGKTVSTLPQLTYDCRQLGEHRGRLTLTNGDYTVYKDFTFHVRFAFEQGVYALANYQGKTVMSYMGERYQGSRTELDAFRLANPNVELGTTPTALHYQHSLFNGADEQKLFYLATSSPNKIYRIQADTLNVMLDLPTAKGTALAFNDEGQPVETDNLTVTFVSDSIMVGILYTQPNATNQAATPSAEYIRWAPQYTFGLTPSGKSRGAYVGYDLRHQRLVSTTSVKTYYIVNNAQEQLTYVGSWPSGPLTHRNVVSLFRQPNTEVAQLYYFYPGYPTATARTRTPSSMIDSARVVPGTDGSTVFTTVTDREVLLYTAGNSIMAYNLPSKGNFSNTPLITLPKEGTITALHVTRDFTRLTVALHTPGQDLSGSVYVYDISSLAAPQLLWKAENATGKIVTLLYRQ